MLRTKKANRIVALFTAVMLVAAVYLWGVREPLRGDGSHEIGYESLLFDTSRVHTIEITMDNWDDLIANATAEEYRECDITIDGEKLGTVGIRAKGNTSLSSVATLGSTRYSFKVEFNHYTKGKTYHGLDKLSLNNLIQDATMMKDYLAYTLMGKMGVPSSLCSYVQITVNGEPWGLYLAVEGVEDSFMDRNGMTKGELYKPDSMSFGGGRGNGRDFDIENFREKDEEDAESSESGAEPETAAAGQETEQPAAQNGTDFGGSSGMPSVPTDGGFAASDGDSAMGDFSASDGDSAMNGFTASSGESTQTADQPDNTRETDETSEKPGSMNGTGFPNMADGESFSADFGGGGFGGFNFGMGSDDVKLVYTDDDPDSYSNIFNNAKTTIRTRDKTRLIESLKKLNAQEDLDHVVNKDEVITYLAVHNFLCNDDSYTGMMVHNYYLYEEKGKLTIIPWDYNLAFGGFSASTNATSTVNSPIDNPVSSGTTDSRPLISWIFSDEEAQEAYHETYDRFISEYIESGWLADEINRVREMIMPYVEADSSFFYSTDEFEKAVSTLQTFCLKRGESIRGQLDGTIPSTTNGQRNSSALIDASEISTADMGSMNSAQGGGGGFGGGEMPSGMPDMNSMPELSSGEIPSGMPSGMPSGGTNDGPRGSFGGSTGSSAADASENPATPAETPAAEETEVPAATTEGKTDAAESAKPQKDGGADRQPPSEGFGSGGFPGGDFMGTGTYGSGYPSSTWIQTGICAAVLLAAVLIIRKAGNHNN